MAWVTRVLYILCQGYLVCEDLIDGGSALNILPYDTLLKIGKGKSNIRTNGNVVRAWRLKEGYYMRDWSWNRIGPNVFKVNCQVIDIKTGYNLLLGRPWIHSAGVVPSTFYQQIQYVMKNELVTIYTDEEKAEKNALYWDWCLYWTFDFSYGRDKTCIFFQPLS